MENKLFYTYAPPTDSNHDIIQKGRIPVDDMMTYFDSLVFDEENRTIWYKGYPFGISSCRGSHASRLNDFNSYATGSYSTVAGIGTIAYSEGQFSAGKYNEQENNDNTYLFVIGNGTENERHNALLVNNNGQTYIPNDTYTYISYSYVRLNEEDYGKDNRFFDIQTFMYSSLNKEHAIYTEPKFGFSVSATYNNVEYNSNSSSYLIESSYIYVPFNTDINLNVNMRTAYVGKPSNANDNTYLGILNELSNDIEHSSDDIIDINITNTISASINKITDGERGLSLYDLALYDLDNHKFSYTDKTIKENEISSYFVYVDKNAYTGTYAFEYSDDAEPDITRLLTDIKIKYTDSSYYCQACYPQLINYNSYVYDNHNKPEIDTAYGNISLDYGIYIAPRFPVIYSVNSAETVKEIIIPKAKEDLYIEIPENCTYLYISIHNNYGISCNSFEITQKSTGLIMPFNSSLYKVEFKNEPHYSTRPTDNNYTTYIFTPNNQENSTVVNYIESGILHLIDETDEINVIDSNSAKSLVNAFKSVESDNN